MRPLFQTRVRLLTTVGRRGFSVRLIATISLVTAALALAPPVQGQSLAGDFQPFNTWWIHPSQGTLGVLFDPPSNPGMICIDRDGDGSAESCYAVPTTVGGGLLPSEALANLRLSPTREVLLAFGDSCSGGARVHFFQVPAPPDPLVFLDSACIAGGINAGHIGFYDTGLCQQGVIGLECTNLGVSPQRIAYVAGQGVQQIEITWFDLAAGNHATTFPGFNPSLQQTRVPVSPSGDVAFVQHDVGGAADSDYTLVDLCPERLGSPLSSAVGGALFDLAPPQAAAEMRDVGGGDFSVRVTHPDLLGGQQDFAFTPCSETPPPVDGACCRSDGTCSQETSDDCDTLGGSWLGPDTDCADCPSHTLIVTIAGPGTGTVTSSPAGIACPGDCEADFFPGLEVDLTATADPGAFFVGWSGDCSGTSTAVQVIMDADRFCTVTFGATADLSLTKVDTPDPVRAGDTVLYTLEVTNLGPFEATGVVVTDTLPAGTSFDASASTPGCNAAGYVVTCNAGNLSSSSSNQVVVGATVDPARRGELFNQAVVSANESDPNAANNSASATTTVIAEADLSITLAAPATVGFGKRLLYEIVITNSGPSAATNVLMTDTLPAGVTTLNGQGSPTQPTDVTCPLEAVPPGTAILAIVAVVDAAINDGTILTNDAEVTADEPDPNPGNNSTTVDTTVVPPPCLPGVQSFVTVADTNTPMPGGPGNFTSFAAPALSNGNVAFRGLRSVSPDPIFEGVYAWTGGALELIADQNTQAPGSTSQFSSFSNFVSIDGSDVAFASIAPFVGGLYARLGGFLQPVATIQTPLPGSGGNLGNFSGPSLHDNALAFYGLSGTGVQGIYTWLSGILRPVADTNTLIPGGTGTFTTFLTTGLAASPSIHDQKVAFIADGADGQRGVYTNLTGTLELVADLNTLIPGGAGTFTSFGHPALDRGLIAFNAVGNGQAGIYLRDCLGLHVVADLNTPIPGSSGTFGFLGGSFFGTLLPGPVSLDQGNVAFIGGSAVFASDHGIYALFDGELIQVITFNDVVDGRIINPNPIHLKALSGSQLAFAASSADGAAVYMAEIGPGLFLDADGDCDVDGDDVDTFAACATGPALGPPPPGCEDLDLDGDGDIDQADFARLQRCHSGEGVPADPACLR